MARSDLPVAAPDPARIEALREEAARGGLYQAEDGPVVRVPSWEEVTFLLDFADVLLAEWQQDKEALERIAETDSTEWHETHGWQAFDFLQGIARAALAVEEDAPAKCYCGDLSWTVEKYGRIAHKQGCPARTDPWHQGDPAAVEEDAPNG